MCNRSGADLGMLGRCRRHDFTGDRPHKAYQFKGYGRGHFAFFLAAEVQVSIAAAQPFLRLPGDGLYSWRSARSARRRSTAVLRAGKR